MYTILMNNDKSLIASKRVTIYQGEKLVDKIQFLCPQTYKGNSLSNYLAVVKYVDQGNELHFEVLAKDSELYKNRLRYVLPVDTKITKFAGNISVRLIFVQDMSANSLNNPVLKTGEHVITVQKDDALTYSPDVVETISILQNKVYDNENSIEELRVCKADSISYNNKTNQLSLKSGTSVLETAVLEDCGDCAEGVPVVDFTVLEPDNSDTIVDNVIEF